VLPIVAVVAGCFLPVLAGARQGDRPLFWIALVAALIGIVFLFLAKLPLYRQGKYFTFGSRPLPQGRRQIYRMAYVFIGTSLLMMLLLLAVLR
jgi:hypothetical protein